MCLGLSLLSVFFLNMHQKWEACMQHTQIDLSWIAVPYGLEKYCSSWIAPSYRLEELFSWWIAQGDFTNFAQGVLCFIDQLGLHWFITASALMFELFKTSEPACKACCALRSSNGKQQISCEATTGKVHSGLAVETSQDLSLSLSLSLCSTWFTELTRRALPRALNADR